MQAQSPQAAEAPLPAIPQLMKEVQEHQKQLDKVRENYTYTSLLTIEEIDANGQVKNTETKEFEVFFVHSRRIRRLVKKNGKPLDEQEQQKETERITRVVEKAENPDQEKANSNHIGVSRLLELMDVRNERRESYRGRPAIVFDFVGRKDAQTHGMAEDSSKKVQGTIWGDEADRQVAHLDVVFNDNFHIAGGLAASIQKGTNFHYDQAKVNGEIWLPTGSEETMLARVLMVKGFRQHVTERDYDFNRFHVEAEQGKGVKVVKEE
jgi:hypothetical protein